MLVTSGPNQDQPNQNLHFNKIPRGVVCFSKGKKNTLFLWSAHFSLLSSHWAPTITWAGKHTTNLGPILYCFFCMKCSSHRYTAIWGPQKTSVHSTSFHYNVDEGTKTDSQPGPLYVWNLTILPVFVWFSPGIPISFSIPKICMLGYLAYLNEMCQCTCTCPAMKWYPIHSG